ncbi:MAG: hypothetical protein J6031_01870 [Bacteroidales bacterium]|nr:hypothetical protein [Bacteroidales bacterium]
MRNIVAYMLIAIALAVSTLPCCIDECGADPDMEQSSDHNHDQPCSPYCNCTVCGCSIAFVSITLDNTESNLPIETHYAQYSEPFVSGETLAIFHPPKTLVVA